MTTTITITPIAGAYLYHRYPGQTQEQPCYIELDAETGDLSADWNGEIGNAVPERVHHQHVLHWRIPLLTERACNELLEELAPLAQRICDGYERQWDGSNHIAHYTDDAQCAIEEIKRKCNDAGWRDSDLLRVWDAPDWFGGIGGNSAQARALGITAASTEEQLQQIAADHEESEELDVLVGAVDYLRELRDELRERAS